MQLYPDIGLTQSHFDTGSCYLSCQPNLLIFPKQYPGKQKREEGLSSTTSQLQREWTLGILCFGAVSLFKTFTATSPYVFLPLLSPHPQLHSILSIVTSRFFLYYSSYIWSSLVLSYCTLYQWFMFFAGVLNNSWLPRRTVIYMSYAALSWHRP